MLGGAEAPPNFLEIFKKKKQFSCIDGVNFDVSGIITGMCIIMHIKKELKKVCFKLFILCAL